MKAKEILKGLKMIKDIEFQLNKVPYNVMKQKLREGEKGHSELFYMMNKEQNKLEFVKNKIKTEKANLRNLINKHDKLKNELDDDKLAKLNVNFKFAKVDDKILELNKLNVLIHLQNQKIESLKQLKKKIKQGQN